MFTEVAPIAEVNAPTTKIPRIEAARVNSFALAVMMLIASVPVR